MGLAHAYDSQAWLNWLEQIAWHSRVEAGGAVAYPGWGCEGGTSGSVGAIGAGGMFLPAGDGVSGDVRG